jgi:hypothetical protein
MPESERRQFRIALGHCFYGFHEYMIRDCSYVTLFRHPVKRVISQYRHYLRDLQRQGTTTPLPIDEFVQTYPFYAEYQLRFILGGHSSPEVHHTPLPGDALDRASQHLAGSFPVIGVLERFDESLLLMKRAFGWRNIYYARQNVNQITTFDQRKNAAAIAWMETKVELDMALYQNANQLLDQAVSEWGEDFQQELRRFRRLNMFYGMLWNNVQAIRKWHLWRRKSPLS